LIDNGTSAKREIKDFPQLLSATSFIRKTLYEIPNPAFWLNGIRGG